MIQLLIAAISVGWHHSSDSGFVSQFVANAKPLFTIPFGEGPFQKGNIDYFWCSPTTLVLLTTINPSRGFKTVDGMRAQTLHAFRVDVTTKKAERSVGLEQSISEWPWYQMKVSPNGKALLCVPIDRRHSGRVIDIRETTFRSLDLLPNSNVCWLPDSESALDIGLQERADRRSRLIVMDPNFPLSAKPQELAAPIDGDALINESNGIPIGVRPDNTVVAVKFYGDADPDSPVRSMAIHRFRFADGRMVQGPAVDFPLHEQTIKPGSIRLNSLGTRLLWQCVMMGTDNKPITCICVISLDGSNYQQIVELSTVVKAKELGSFGGFETEKEPINGAEWMPDGTAISFISNGTMFAVPDK